MNEISIGLINEMTKLVRATDTAIAFGSGNVEVYATPAMIALMEETCLKCVEPHLTNGKTTVGFELNVRHLQPTRVGEEVRSKCTLVFMSDRKLTFEVEVFCNNNLIGNGHHTRYIVEKNDF